MVGCAFVQYNMKKEALKAIKECNMKPLLGKYIFVYIFLPNRSKLSNLGIVTNPKLHKQMGQEISCVVEFESFVKAWILIILYQDKGHKHL